MARGNGTAPDYDWRLEIVLPIIILICGVIAFLVWAYNTNKTYESPNDIQWNNGICAACETLWHYIDSTSTINSTYYIYECECGKHRMKSWSLR